MICKGGYPQLIKKTTGNRPVIQMPKLTLINRKRTDKHHRLGLFKSRTWLHHLLHPHIRKRIPYFGFFAILHPRIEKYIPHLPGSQTRRSLLGRIHDAYFTDDIPLPRHKRNDMIPWLYCPVKDSNEEYYTSVIVVPGIRRTWQR